MSIDCSIVYLKVGDKLVPEIFDNWDKAVEFFKSEDTAVRIDYVKED